VILIILMEIKPLEEWLQHRNRSHEISFTAEQGRMSMAALDAALGYRARRIARYVATPAEEPGRENVTITLTRLRPEDVDEIARQLGALPHVKGVDRRNG